MKEARAIVALNLDDILFINPKGEKTHYFSGGMIAS